MIEVFGDSSCLEQLEESKQLTLHELYEPSEIEKAFLTDKDEIVWNASSQIV